ncbi:zinc finger, c3HC4 type (RING finger) domain-containing protein [Phthorimaea operculella]|nr:zinc finger, c3HC4 type (RING finger) domain-containing protein [Phthorimaea operculella]
MPLSTNLVEISNGEPGTPRTQFFREQTTTVSFVAAGRMECGICRTAPITDAVIRCGHALCDGCWTQFHIGDNCPFCRRLIEDKLRLFII